MSTPRVSLRARPLLGRVTQAAGLLALVAGLATCEQAKHPTDTNDEPSAQLARGGPGRAAGSLDEQGEVGVEAIALPVDQSVSTTAPAPAFRITQTGTGPNGIFRINRTTSSAK